MKLHIFYLTIFLFLFLLLGQAKNLQAANAVVGNGTPASCTEVAFDDALLSAGNGGGTITFNCGINETTINLTTAKFLFLGNITINGNDRIILNINNIDRHFFVGGGITLQLQNITLRDGYSLVGGGAIEASGADVVLENVQLLNNYSSISGGAIYCYDGTLTISNTLFENNASGTGGAIFNDGCTVTITNTTFLNNQALDTFGRGGGIDNRAPGALTINNSLLQGNQAGDGGGLFNDSYATAVLNSVTLANNNSGYGGGVENSGEITVNNSLFDGNTATGSGGGLWNLGGIVVLQRTTLTNNSAYEGGGINSYGNSLTLTDVNITNNSATGTDGGGIYHVAGTAFITNATLNGNQAINNGGGIYQASDDNLTLTNATLVNNEAGSLGGAFYHYGRYAVLTNVTIANNTAWVAGNAIYEDSPQTPGNPGVVQMVNSVIFGDAVNCDGGFFLSLGHNISQGSCASLNTATDQDNYAGTLLLGNLSFNGGTFPMQTIPLLTGSPLIDTADPTACSATDQRGFSRIGICDIGAIEYTANTSYQLYLPFLKR